MPNYTSLIFSVPKDKFGLFKKTRPKDETAISMSAWFGDFSQEHDEDVELPDAAYHVYFYLTDPYGGQDGCTIETFVEDSEKDCRLSSRNLTQLTAVMQPQQDYRYQKHRGSPLKL